MKTAVNLGRFSQLDEPDAKKAYNDVLFDEVAPRYDFITRALSLGRDAAWKKILVKGLPDNGAPVCIDLACGTGDLVESLAHRFPSGKVHGVDLNASMLAEAQRRGLPKHVLLHQSDMQELPFEDASADIVTGSYALRNAPDLDRALAEICRVLRPGGRAAFLDFSRSARWSSLQVGLVKAWGSFWGLAVHGKPCVYGYIAESLRRFPDRDALAAKLEKAGLAVQQRRYFFGGLLELTFADRVDHGA